MKHNLILAVFFSFFSISQTYAGAMGVDNGMIINGDGRGGGDVVSCSDNQGESRYSGLYSLDYLLTRVDDFNENDSEHFKFTNNKAAMDILLSIAARLEDVSPVAAKSLFSFISLVENDRWSEEGHQNERFRVWIPTLRLLDYKDEDFDFINGLPNNCYDNSSGNLNISQMILREDVNENILYHYNRNLFTQLKTNPLQMSYLLIHEWLRDYTIHAAVIRRVNSYLHSTAFFESASYKAASAISRMGLIFNKKVQNDQLVQLMNFDTGVGCNGDCGYLNVHIKVKNVTYHKYVALYYSENGGEWSEVPATYVRPLSNGHEEWAIESNFSTSGSSIEFAVKYSVGGQIYWDNNGGKNYRGVFRYKNTTPYF